MRGQPATNGQPALPYTGAPPSHYPNEIRGKVVPPAQPTIPYEGTPPYTEATRYTAASTSAPSYASDPASTAPPPSYTASVDTPLYKASADTSSSPLLHVYHSGMSHRNTQILSPDKTTVLYTIKINNGGLFGSKPNVRVYKANTLTVVGSATFHSLTREIELVIHDNPLTLSASGLFTSAHEWTSLATRIVGMRLKWKRDSRDMICLDQQDRVCAKFENNMWALQKDGKFEVWPFVDEFWMDEIVVTGLAMLEAKRR